MNYDMTELQSCIEDQGYAVVKAFVSPAVTVEIRRMWHRYPLPYGEKGYWRGRHNYAMHKVPLPFMSKMGLSQHSCVQRYECFFWNQPEHDLTAQTSLSCHLLRNAVSRFPPIAHIYPVDGYATSYRPTRSDVGDSGVKFHDDRMGCGERHALQVSLQLSTPQIDFKGGGTLIKRPDGNVVNVHLEHGVTAGDLILFDQLLEHAVEPVASSDPEDPLSGHWRILMPLHPVVDYPHQWVKGMVVHPSMHPINLVP